MSKTTFILILIWAIGTLAILKIYGDFQMSWFWVASPVLVPFIWMGLVWLWLNKQ